MIADRLIAELRGGPASASALAQRLGVSPNTTSRALAALGERVVRLGRGRASRFALTRPLGRSGSHWPLSRITPERRPELLGELHALAGGWFLEPARALPVFLHDEFAGGLFPDLPWFLDDARPQGFLGRAFVHRHAAILEAPADLTLWQADDVVVALLRLGTDLPGDLVLGEAALERALTLAVHDGQPSALVRSERDAVYPRFAEQAAAGDPVGSSAGGEQPKFTAEVAQPDGRREAVIVKFARHDPENIVQRRWANLLACEYIAGEVLAAHGLATPAAELIDSGGWRFLQSTRFDRTPQGGRIGVVSLRALDAAYFGAGTGSWVQVADALRSRGFLDAEDAARLRRLAHFGDLIGNSDMHFGNASFFVDLDSACLRLAPVYDMLPMHYRPGAGGIMRDQPYALTMPPARAAEDWFWAAAAAREFWRRVKEDTRVGPRFRAIAQGNENRVLVLLQQLGA